MNMLANQSAPANRRPAGQSDGSGEFHRDRCNAGGLNLGERMRNDAVTRPNTSVRLIKTERRKEQDQKKSALHFLSLKE
ncbi:MAG: hypothetical protein HY204_01640 [Nitrospirae bacterium]|nr:hypothetical protein [Nitrospirota bacterium]